MDNQIKASIEAVTAQALAAVDQGSGPAAASSPEHQARLALMAGQLDPGGIDLSNARLRRIRRVLLKLIRPSTEVQASFNVETQLALTSVTADLGSVQSSIRSAQFGVASAESTSSRNSGLIADTKDDLTVLRSALDDKIDIASARDLEVRVNATTHELRGQLDAEIARADSLDRSLQELRSDLQRAHGELAQHRALVDLTLRELRSTLPDDVPLGKRLTRPLDDRFNQFYVDIEAALRGSRETVMNSQRRYLGLMHDLPGPVLDIGAGRGEWLELLGEGGIPARGVDINAAFVESCRGRGLDVVHVDAFDHLRSIPESSVGAVTLFRVVEHLPFDTLTELLALALTALRPGGVLILETPNPSNLKVGSMSFWNDPTHIRPLPPHLLQFAVQWSGFVDVEIRFSEQIDPRQLEIDGQKSPALDDINWAMFGPEDYAIVARRP